jgi:hypothetical protein
VYCRAIACDFDGTGSFNERLAPELAAALSQARTAGFVTLLVTGRVLEDIEQLCPDLAMFDAVVAENGAIVWLAAQGRTIQIGQPPSQEFLGELRGRAIPFHVGAVVVGTWDRHAVEVLELVRRCAIDAQLVFNRQALRSPQRRRVPRRHRVRIGILATSSFDRRRLLSLGCRGPRG